MANAGVMVPPQLEFAVQQETYNTDALVVLKHLRPEWTTNEVKFKVFSEGCINTLVGCFRDENPDDMVMFRIFQQRKDKLIDRQREIKNVQILSAKGLAPQVLGFFQNGFCYQFLPGKCLNIDSILEPKTWRLAAEAFANFHSFPDEGQALPTNLSSFLKEHIQAFPEHVLKQVSSLVPECIIDKESLLKDADIIQKDLQKLNSPVVFCHGDPTPLNMILSQSEDSVMFIDFEFSHYGYQAFDIAFHFTEFAGMEPPDFSRFPNEEFQLSWLSVYANSWFSKNRHCCATENDVKLLYQQVESCVPAVHFVAGVVTVAMGMTSETLSLTYAAERFKQYFKTRAELLQHSS